MDYRIKTQEANIFLSQLKNLCVKWLGRSVNGNVTVGLGRLFEITGIGMGTKVVPQFLISADSDILHLVSGDSKAEENEKVAEMLVGRKIINAYTEDTKLCVQLQGKESNVFALSNWCVCQPETDEMQLKIENGALIKTQKIRRRWSFEHADARDKWHPFPLVDDIDNTVVPDVYPRWIAPLVGMVLKHGLKSADMNLFDLGFATRHPWEKGLEIEECHGAYALHATCAISITWGNLPKRVYYCDCSKETFEKDIQSVVNSPVVRASLQENNTLQLDFSGCTIEIVTAEDGKESWRLFEDESETSDLLDLVVADSWIVEHFSKRM